MFEITATSELIAYMVAGFFTALIVQSAGVLFASILSFYKGGLR